MESQSLLHTLSGHALTVRTLAFSKDSAACSKRLCPCVGSMVPRLATLSLLGARLAALGGSALPG